MPVLSVPTSPPPVRSDRKLVPVAQLMRSSRTMPPRLRGMPPPRPPKEERPRASSMLLRSPGVHRIALSKGPANDRTPSAFNQDEPDAARSNEQPRHHAINQV